MFSFSDRARAVAGPVPVAPVGERDMDQVIARGRGRSDIEVRFRVRVDWTDDPGSYSSVVALTVAAS